MMKRTLFIYLSCCFLGLMATQKALAYDFGAEIDEGVTICHNIVPNGPEVVEVTSKKSEKKPHVTMATIGSVDCGKTTLTCAINIILLKAGLTDCYLSFDEVDSLPEEKERGISVEPFTMEFETEKVRYTHIDCPGHEDYLDRTAKAIRRIDGAIIVVSVDSWGDEDWESVTERVFRMARNAKVKKLIVFLNKVDLAEFVEWVDEHTIAKREAYVRLLLEKYKFSKDTPVIRGSALGALNGVEKWEKVVKTLLDTCDKWFGE